MSPSGATETIAGQPFLPPLPGTALYCNRHPGAALRLPPAILLCPSGACDASSFFITTAEDAEIKQYLFFMCSVLRRRKDPCRPGKDFHVGSTDEDIGSYKSASIGIGMRFHFPGWPFMA